ncbi:MAG: hypothetical protein ACRDXC_05595 [Acidimicrobiales bacterium]
MLAPADARVDAAVESVPDEARTARALVATDVSRLAASTLAGGLPRARALTDALLVPATATGTLAAGVASARQRLERGLSQVVAGRNPRGGPPPTLLRIGHYQVVRASEGLLPPARAGEGAETGPAFRWNSRAARRAIGLAALRAGLDGRAATPADAVAAVMGDPNGPLGIGRAGPGSPADWITSLAGPARALVAAESTAWTTRLWTAVDWALLPSRRFVVGGPDRWWRWNDPPSSCKVAIRGRADVRVEAAAGNEGLGGAQLVVQDGLPRVAARRALLVGALVDALSSRPGQEPAAVPGRVIGWWPDCGKAWVVPVAAGTLAAAADAVVAAAAALLGGAAPRGESWPRCEAAP